MVVREIMNKISLLLFLPMLSVALPIKNLLIKPTGQFNVSVKEYQWQNTMICPDYFYQNSESQFYKNNPMHCHMLRAYIYYPAVNNSQSYSSYWSHDIISLNNDILNNVIESKNLNYAQKTLSLMQKEKSYIFTDGEVAKGKYPMLIFQPGLGFNAYSYQNFIANIVSHGYIVVAIDSAYNQVMISQDNPTLDIHVPKSDNGKMSASDVALIVAPTHSNLALAKSDYSFVLNKLKTDISLNNITANINFDEIGGFGHSMGSSSIYEASLESNTQLKAYASLDIGSSNDKSLYVYQPNIPTLFLRAANDKEFGKTIDASNQFNLLTQNQYLALMSPSESNVTYSTHRAFTDISTTYYGNALIDLWYRAYGQAPLDISNFMYSNKINGLQLSKEINQYLVLFFDQYLKNKPNSYFMKCHAINKNSILYCGPKVIK
jgi:hypothetical protein